MTEPSLVDEFLRSLRLAVKRATLYPGDHPALESFLHELKEKADALVAASGSFRIGVAPRALRLEDGTWRSEKIHKEVARMLHARRVRTLEIYRGMTIEELASLIRALALSPRDLPREAGLKKILEEKGGRHVVIQELDYSSLLSGVGEEVRDAWAYLLEEAVIRKSLREGQQAAQGFLRTLEQIPLEKLTAEERIFQQLVSFFSILKQEDARAFRASVAAVVKNILCRHERLLPPALEEKFCGLLEGFDEEALATGLFEALRDDPSFDASKLYLWTRLTKGKKHGLMAALLERFFEPQLSRLPLPQLQAKFTSLIQGISSYPYPAPYYQAFLSLLDKIPEEKRAGLDRDSLWKHEVSLHLFFLQQETRPDRLISHFETLARSLNRLREAREFFLLKELHRLLIQRREILLSHPDYSPTLKRLCGFVEQLILNEETFPEQDYFLDNLKTSSLGVNFYLEKIFGEGRVSPAILKLFFRLFLDHIFYFDINLDEKAGDREFLERMISSLKEVDTLPSFVTLKNIFNLGDVGLKRKVLQAMQRLSTFDESFLWPHFREGALSWHREALLLLRKKPAALEKALGMLLGEASPFGLRNKRLIEGVRLVAELELKEAVPHLRLLNQRPFFWNRRLRQEARRVLESWNVR